MKDLKQVLTSLNERLKYLNSPEYRESKSYDSDSVFELEKIAAIHECTLTIVFVQDLLLKQVRSKEEIKPPTDRLNEIMSKLNNLGVFYGTDYSGDYHNKYPHELYSFAIELDKHRGGFESHILKEGEIESTLSIVGGDNPTEMIIQLLESSYTKILELIKQNDE